MHCKSCNTEKDAADFYSSNKTHCKECVKSAANKYRIENIERVRQYDKMRGSMPHRVAARAKYKETLAYAESHEAAAKRWAAKHKDRRAASVAVGNAVRDGRLLRQPCWECGGKAEAHHPDYSRPLDVVWLCPKHHKQAHAIAAEGRA